MESFNQDNVKTYTTDGKVRHKSNDEDINEKIGKILGSKWTEYRKKWDAVNNFEIQTDFPMFLHLDLHQVCNYSCPHCNISHIEELKKQFDGKISEKMDFDKYKRIIDEGSEHGCPSVEPQGTNEPLLIKDFEKYLKYAHEKNFIDIMINTNGSALTERRSKQLLDSGITRLRFSLDAATPETYKKVRVGSIPLEKVHKNIFKFLELKEKGGYKLPVTGVSMCVMRGNEHEQEMFENFWIDKVDMVSLQAFTPPNYAPENKVLFQSFFPESFKGNRKSETEKKELQEFKCVQPFQRVVIRNDNITACCNTYSNQLSIGHLKDGIYNAWNSDFAKQIREMHLCGRYYENATCKRCVETTDFE